MLTQRPSGVFHIRLAGGVVMSMVLDDGMSEEEFLAWLDSLDSSEELDEQG